MIFVRDIGGVEKTWLHGTEHFTDLQNMTCSPVSNVVQLGPVKRFLFESFRGDVRANESARAGPLRGLSCAPWKHKVTS